MKKYIFIDRDGVINEDPKTESTYVNRWDEFHFIPGVKTAIAKLTKAGFSIYIVSNQAGVAKGFYTKQDLDDITNKMLAEIEAEGGIITDVVYCVHRNEDNCNCRKPKAGLFKKIADNEHGIDYSKWFYIGDSQRDIIAANQAGLKSLLVLSGKTKASDLDSLDPKPNIVKKDLLEAVEWILGDKDYRQ